MFAKISKIDRKIANNCKNSANFEFGAVQRFVNLVDLGKCCKMSIWLQNSALIQPRTGRLKFAELVVGSTT